MWPSQIISLELGADGGESQSPNFSGDGLEPDLRLGASFQSFCFLLTSWRISVCTIFKLVLGLSLILNSNNYLDLIHLCITQKLSSTLPLLRPQILQFPTKCLLSIEKPLLGTIFATHLESESSLTQMKVCKTICNWLGLRAVFFYSSIGVLSSCFVGIRSLPFQVFVWWIWLLVVSAYIFC